MLVDVYSEPRIVVMTSFEFSGKYLLTVGQHRQILDGVGIIGQPMDVSQFGPMELSWEGLFSLYKI